MTTPISSDPTRHGNCRILDQPISGGRPSCDHPTLTFCTITECSIIYRALVLPAHLEDKDLSAFQSSTSFHTYRCSTESLFLCV